MPVEEPNALYSKDSVKMHPSDRWSLDSNGAQPLLGACAVTCASCMFSRTESAASRWLHPKADVAELADALDSKSGIRKDVWVRPPPSAPFQTKTRGRSAMVACRSHTKVPQGNTSEAHSSQIVQLDICCLGRSLEPRFLT